jgi:hypothetical protein
LRKPEKQREPAFAGSLLLLPRTRGVLLAETARDVAEDVLDLVAEDDQDYDHDHRDQDENKGVLNHTLPFLTVEQSAKAKIKAGQHAIHLLLEQIEQHPVSHRAAIKSTNARQKNG